MTRDPSWMPLSLRKSPELDLAVELATRQENERESKEDLIKKYLVLGMAEEQRRRVHADERLKPLIRSKALLFEEWLEAERAPGYKNRDFIAPDCYPTARFVYEALTKKSDDSN
jgi:hypothetical protein